MVLEFLQITVITIVILSGGGILCSDSKIINTYDLLVSMVNVSSTLICRSNSMNNSAIWERDSGVMLFSMSRVNQYETSRFDVDLSFMPDYVLTLLNPRFSDAGVWLCKPEQSEVYSKQITHIVVESKPVCERSRPIDETSEGVNASCSIKFAGKDLYSITWYFGTDNNLTPMNGSQLSVFNETIDNVTKTTIYSTVSVTGRSLTNGSFFKCHIQFELPNYSNTSKYSFNCTTQEYTRRLQIEISDEEIRSTLKHPYSSIRGAVDQVSPSTQRTDGIGGDKPSLAADKNPNDEGATLPGQSTDNTNSYSLIIGMVVAFVVIVIVLIVVIICMYVHFRSATGSRKRRAESSYAMPLPPDLPRSTSYDQINIEPIYNEPNASRESIISSHSYNYPSRCSLDNAPPLPERDMTVIQSTLAGNRDPDWTSANNLCDEEENTGDPLMDPGEYLRMPNDPLHVNQERSDEFGYTICPGDFVQNTKPMPTSRETGYEKMRDNENKREHPITVTIQYEDLHKESKDLESVMEDTSFIEQLPENIESVIQQTRQDKNNRNQKMIPKKEDGYEKPGQEVPDQARYFPLIKKDGEFDVADVSFEKIHEAETEALLSSNILGTEKTNTNLLGQQCLPKTGRREYLKLIDD